MPRQSDLRFTFKPLQGDAFDVVSFTLEEGLSQPFKLELELASHDPAIDFNRVLDLSAVFTLWRGETPVRHVHGLVSLFRQGDTGFRRTRYSAVVEPTLARTGLRSNWRIFQGQTVPQIIQTVLAGQSLSDLQSTLCFEHQPREYCVQAGETDLDFAMANPLEFGTRAEVTTWERSLTPAFYGLDIEYAYGMDDELPSGIRPPTWAFLLSDYWRDKLDLSREQVRTALAHPRISVTELHSGQWIELGEQPQLYPVEHGVPELPVLLNRLLKPIRYDDLGLLGFGQWDGDPNERFTDADSRRWMARFDADSDWPTPASRVNAPPALSTPSAPGTMAACFVAGMACPQAGWWFAVDQVDSRRAFKQGEAFPERLNDCGDTLLLWQRDPDQTPPEPARYANSHQPAPRAGRWEMALDRCVECEVLLNQPLPAHQGQSVGWHWTLPGMRARSDEPCPYPGGWVCEYKPGSQRVLDYATAMPRVDGEKVVWLWTGFHPT